MADQAEFRDNFSSESFSTNYSNSHSKILIATDLFYDFLIAAGARDNVPALAVLFEENLGSVNEIMNASCRRLEKCPGISTELAVNLKILQKVFMKCREHCAEIPKVSEERSLKNIVKLLENKIAHLPEESFAYIFRDSNGDVGRVYVNSREQEFSSPIVVSEVIRNAVLEDAREIFCAHNHPSGNNPSEQDYYAANELRCRLDAYSIKMKEFFLFMPALPGNDGSGNENNCICKNLFGNSLGMLY